MSDDKKLRPFRVTLMRDAFQEISTVVEAESADAAQEIATSYGYEGEWERGDVHLYDHSELHSVEELTANER